MRGAVWALLLAGAAAGDEGNATRVYSRGYRRAPRLASDAALLTVVEITAADLAAAPSSIDWSAKGGTSKINDQAECGSCWAFSTMQTVESAVFMSSGAQPGDLPPPLSVQQLVACDKGVDGCCEGCQGGDMAAGIKYLVKAGGMDSAKDYPDTSSKSGKNGLCKWSKKTVVTVQGSSFAVPECERGSSCKTDEDKLAAAVAKYGPLAISINSGDKQSCDWAKYKSGVLKPKCAANPNKVDHGVQLVGYDKTASPPYWKVRNSWGSSWGEQGFIRLPMDGSNSCCIGCGALIVHAKSQSANAKSQNPPPVPPPAPAPTRRYMRGYRRMPHNTARMPNLVITDEHLAAAPDAIDWSAKGGVSAIQDQGDCGSCFAFSTMETVESAVFMSSGHLPPPLSVQQLVACDGCKDASKCPDGGCDGGDPKSSVDYIVKAGGMDSAKDYPDTSSKNGKTGRCTWSNRTVVKVQGYSMAVKECETGITCKTDEDKLAAAVATYGPLSISINSGAKQPCDWGKYKGGVLKPKCRAAPALNDHSVQLVGYDKTASPPYWKVRNSWGTSWGENGFIRLPMDGSNSCCVGCEALIIHATSINPAH